MSDPRTFEDYTTSFDECDVCEHVNRVTYWESTLTHRWSREAFDCIGCGEHHSEIHGSNLDRGAASMLATLLLGCMAAGAALFLLGVLNMLGGHFDWWPLLIAGFWLVAAPLAIALIIGANRKDYQS